jgi:hypothetical protein
MTREEVWMRAFGAYVGSFNARAETAIRAADECLAAFEQRFPCDSGSGAEAMRPEGAQPVGPQSGGEQPHRPKPVSSQKAG